MDDVYTVESLQRSLIDACERENILQSALQTAKEDVQEWKEQAMVSKIKFQELDDAFEVEEAKTNDERLARQEAEERTCQYQAEVLKAKRREINANEHCDSAESEVLRLEEDLAAERSAAAAVDLQLCQIREDLALAEHNESAAYEQRDTLENGDFISSKHDRGLLTEIDKGMEETMIHRASLSTWKNPPIIATEMPAFPKPARLRPALASATACRTEVVKATARILTGPRADLKTPLWKWMWMLRENHCIFSFKAPMALRSPVMHL